MQVGRNQIVRIIGGEEAQHRCPEQFFETWQDHNTHSCRKVLAVLEAEIAPPEMMAQLTKLV
jgi:hypothetical protein